MLDVANETTGLSISARPFTINWHMRRFPLRTVT